MSEDNTNKLIFLGAALLLAFIIWRSVKSAVVKERRNVALQKFASNPVAQHAARYYSALIPGFTEDEEEVFAVSREIDGQKGFDEVARQYKRMYNRDLLKDLQKYLDPQEFKKFAQIISGKYYPPTDWAMRFYEALHGSIFGEDEEAIYQLGREICPRDFAKVVDVYKQKFRRVLTRDLFDLLTKEEVNKFLYYVNLPKDCKIYQNG